MTFVAAPEKLGNDERACLLRAARKQLIALQDEFNRLEGMGGEGAKAAAGSAALELHCLKRAITWLWRDQTPGDG